MQRFYAEIPTWAEAYGPRPLRRDAVLLENEWQDHAEGSRRNGSRKITSKRYKKILL